MKQENNMKRQTNEVNPKAGTLKPNTQNLSNLKNAFRKLIASVMMLAVIAMTPGVVSAGVKSDDTCCTPETTGMKKLVKSVKLNIPSREMITKADIEAHLNMIRSLTENKMKKYSALFASSDQAISRSFRSETTIFLPAATVKVSDVSISNYFQAENINMNASFVTSDEDIRDIFQADNGGIVVNASAEIADDQITSNFRAENINLPSVEVLTKADAEINNNLKKDNSLGYAKK